MSLTWKTYKSGNLKETSQSQGIWDRIPKVREFCCLKFIFSEVEDPNFENFLGSVPPDPLNGLRLTVELNPGLENSGNFILSGKWQPCKCQGSVIVPEGRVRQSESDDIFVSELKAKELMITGSSVLLSLFQWENKNVDLITMGSLRFGKEINISSDFL